MNFTHPLGKFSHPGGESDVLSNDCFWKSRFHVLLPPLHVEQGTISCKPCCVTRGVQWTSGSTGALLLSPGRQRAPIRSILDSGKIPLSPLRMGFCEIRHPPILIKFFEITNSINNDVLRGLQHRSSTWGIVVGVCHTPRHYKNQIEGVLQNQGVKMCYHFSAKKGPKL